MIGKTIGNYRIVGRLGEGGMGEVFLAAHPELGRKAAVKILREDLARSSENVERFLNEARAADAIHHAAIVKVLDLGTMPSGAPYIVMELLDGETLGARLQRSGRFDPHAAARIVGRAADALAAAHAAGIVHRDLKPDNLFLISDASGADVVKVLDFGIAKLGEPWQRTVSVKTQSGVVMGTPVYMSPELCSGARHVDHRSDVYSLGIILYEMLCGQPPFRSEGFGELAHLHLSATPVPPREHRPEIPQALSAVVLRALAKDPAGRFASMVELGAALAPWTSDAPSGPRPARRLGGWPAALGAFLVVGGGAAALWSLRSPPTPEPAAAPALAPAAAPQIATRPAAPPIPPRPAQPTTTPALSPPPAKTEAASAPPGKQRATTARPRPQVAPTPPPHIVPAPGRRREPVPL